MVMRAVTRTALASALLATAATAQGPRIAAERSRIAVPASAAPDSALCWDCARRRQPLISFLEMQLGMWPQWSVNKFVRPGNIGDVNPAFWSRNVRGVWEWDPNSFDINQVGHPGQGSMYFNGWRTNGYGFWGSQLATLGGSLFWECCGERNLPSNNDLLTTWIGGATLGEVGRRLSDLWLDNSLRGGARLRHEAAAFAVNPVRGLDRIFRGHAWKVGPNPPGAHPAWLQGVVGTGAVVLDVRRATNNGALGGAKFVTRFAYGKYTDAVGKPFDHFELEAELTSIPLAHLYMVRSRGSLFGKFLGPPADSTLLLTSFLRYDYVRSRAFELGQQTISLALLRSRKLSEHVTLVGEASIRAVPIAAIEDDFLTPFGENRNYDYAYGGGVGGMGTITWDDRAMLRWTTTTEALRVADGAASSHLLERTELYGQYQLGPLYGIGVGYRHQSRRTFVSPGVRSTARAPEVWVSLLRALPSWNY